MLRRHSLFVAIVLAASSAVWPAEARSSDIDGRFEIGGGRKMYLECRGMGVPVVVVVAGMRASAEDWTKAEPGKLDVFSELAGFTRVCAYDRPGTPVGDAPSRSDPVPQPVTAGDAVADLHALLAAGGITAPFVMVAHSYGGLIARLYAMNYPEQVKGMVLVHTLSEGLQDAETPEEWVIQRALLNGDLTEALRLYPPIERADAERSFDQIRAARPLRPMPLIVLSADRPWGPLIPKLIADGVLPASTPPDFGYVTDRAQRLAQAKLAALVPGARHVTNTDSGHEIHKDQPQLVVDSIREVVEAVRRGKASLDRQ
ncbi:alpha/beta fold hydrolase [Kaistia dalseonensis]|uniref:Pimeloyl-ACP methyl ester carboxylesterase n=1 Tax=Kaistia dalseonensis TaxID=410840 RepID=A0ABU0H0V5_9HYPH|nr:alpha/beta fold hydrolase [Kaistia dalseonensis]MCX5493372.1 alpha/beta fold hydrolase [Kaistia dalseonensis]MDQ0435930.1 pimeloyl-ACP methyl ester carboxylesterase [Kaistia dalseonensis]